MSPAPGRANPPSQAWAAAGRVAVIGGGIAGLACAWRLARGGARVTLFESSGQLGGLGSAFDYQGVPVERFYHCMLPNDSHLLPLLAELGLVDDVYWRQTSFAYLQGQRLYPLNGAADLLRFDVLPLHERLRVGLTGLWGRVASAEGLDDISCEDWLTRLSGRRAFEAFWRPLLQAKFGDRHREVPALWFWTRFNREKGSGPEMKGYLPGGYRRIADSLAQHIRGAGGDIRLHAPVRQLALDGQGRPCITANGPGSPATAETFDRVVYAAAYPGLSAMLEPTLRSRLGAAVDETLDLQGVINTLFVLRRSLSPHYWVATPDPQMPFQGVVETTTLLDRGPLQGQHLVYLTRYLHRQDSGYARDDDDLLRADQAALLKAFPALSSADVSARFVFRSPLVEPVYIRGYARRKPAAALVPGRVYLATTSQVYPQVTSWNGSVGLVGEVMARMSRELGPNAPSLPEMRAPLESPGACLPASSDAAASRATALGVPTPGGGA